MDKYKKDQLIRRTKRGQWKSKKLKSKRKSKRKSKQKNKKKKTRTKQRNTKKKLYKKTRKKRMKGGSVPLETPVKIVPPELTDQFLLSPPFGLFDYQRDALDQDQVNIILKYYMKYFYGLESRDLSKGVSFAPSISSQGGDVEAAPVEGRAGGTLNIMTQLLNLFPNPMLLYLFNLLEQLYFLVYYQTFITQCKSVIDMQGEEPPSVEKSWQDQLRGTRAATEAAASAAAQDAVVLQTQLTEAISHAEAAHGQANQDTAAAEAAAEASHAVEVLQTQLDEAISRSGRVPGPGVLDVDFANVSWPNYWNLGETKGIAKIAQSKELEKEKKRLQMSRKKIQERMLEEPSALRQIGVMTGLTNSWEDTQRENTTMDLALLELQTIEDRYMDHISAILQSIPELQSLDEDSLLNRARDEKIDIDIFAQPSPRDRARSTGEVAVEELAGSINAQWTLAERGLGGRARARPLSLGAAHLGPLEGRPGYSIHKTHMLFLEKMFEPFTPYEDPTAAEGRDRSSISQLIIATRIERILKELIKKKSEIDPKDFDIEVIEEAIGNIEMLEKENAYPLSEIPNCLLRFNNLPTRSDGQIGSSKVGNSALLDIGPEPGEENFFLRNMIYQAMGFQFESNYIFCGENYPFVQPHTLAEIQKSEGQIPSPLLDSKHSQEFPTMGQNFENSIAYFIVQIINRLDVSEIPRSHVKFIVSGRPGDPIHSWDPWPVLKFITTSEKFIGKITEGEKKLLYILPAGILTFCAGVVLTTDFERWYKISDEEDLSKYSYEPIRGRKLLASGFFTKSGMLYGRVVDGVGLRDGREPTELKPDFDVKLIQNFQLFANYSLRKSKLLESIKRDHDQTGGMDAGAAGEEGAAGGTDPGTAPKPPLHEKLPEPFVINKEINELFLFHGTSQKVVNEILQFNFDAAFNRSGLYGKYCYFTNHLCKALQYSEPFVYREEILFLQKVGKHIASQGDTITVTFQNNTPYTLYFTNDGELIDSCLSSSTFSINKTISEQMTIRALTHRPEDTGGAGGPESSTRLDFSFVVDTIYTTMDVAVIVRKDYRWPVFLSRVIMGQNPFTTHIPLVGLEGESRIKDLHSTLSKSEFTLGKSHTEGESTSIFAQGLDDKTRDSYPVATTESGVLIEEFSAGAPEPGWRGEIIDTRLTVPRVKNDRGELYIPRMPRPEGDGWEGSFEARAAGGSIRFDQISSDRHLIASREARKNLQEFEAAKEAVWEWATKNDTDNIFGTQTVHGTPENVVAHQRVTTALRALSLDLVIGPTSVKDWVKFFESNKNNLSETFKTLLDTAKREIKLDKLLSNQTATCITEAKTRCSEQGYGEDCLHFPHVYSPTMGEGFPELICYLKGQDYKPGDKFWGVMPGRRQIHNEFMVANCQENVYMEYLLLFKYATWADIKEIYIPFVCEGYVIYKPPP